MRFLLEGMLNVRAMAAVATVKMITAKNLGFMVHIFVLKMQEGFRFHKNHAPFAFLGIHGLGQSPNRRWLIS
jgi:hypothetical protein